ncbi:MAG: hypothetical protein AAFP90_07065 [Planctomycetota bacterium]
MGSVATAIAFTRNKNQIAIGTSNGTVYVYDIRFSDGTGNNAAKKVYTKRVKTMRSHRGPIRHLLFSADDSRLVSSCEQSTILWTMDQIRQPDNVQAPQHAIEGLRLISSASYSPNGEFVVFEELDSKVIHLRDAKTKQVVRSIPLQHPGVVSLRFSPNSRWLAVGQSASRLVLIDLQKNEVATTFRQPAKRLEVTAIAFSNDSKRLVAGFGVLLTTNTTVPQRPVVWDLETGSQIATLDDVVNACSSLEFNKDGSVLFVANHAGQIFRYDPASWAMQERLGKAPFGVLDIAINHDASLLYAACSDGNARVMDVDQHQWIDQWAAHAGRVNGIALDMKENSVITAGEDTKVRIWNRRLKRQVMQFSINAPGTCFQPGEEPAASVRTPRPGAGRRGRYLDDT